MKTLVLIAGVARSGSTATDFILGNRGDSFSLGEIHAWYRPFRSHHLKPVCSCGDRLEACMVWSKISRPPARHLHRHVADAVGADIVIDSSKNLSWIRDAYRWGTRDGLRVEVVLPWRGTKAIAHSYWKRDVLSWADNLNGYMRRLEELRVPWRPLMFDELMHDPETCLRPLYAHLGSSYEPGQEEFWEGQFHSLFGSGGTRAQLGDHASTLSVGAFSQEFEDYWAQLPSGLLLQMAELDEQVRRGRSAANPPRIPPRWYLKHRAINLRDRAILQVRPRTDIR